MSIPAPDEILDSQREREDDAAREKRLFALQVIQPGLMLGLMDGSVSTLAPLFAAAFATHNSNQTFLVGLAASLGAGISMGFSEALFRRWHSHRARPSLERVASFCGLMTALGGLGHTMPYLDFQHSNPPPVDRRGGGLHLARLLRVIAWVRHKYMDTPWASAILQIVLGGALVFFVGIMIGRA